MSRVRATSCTSHVSAPDSESDTCARMPQAWQRIQQTNETHRAPHAPRSELCLTRFGGGHDYQRELIETGAVGSIMGGISLNTGTLLLGVGRHVGVVSTAGEGATSSPHIPPNDSVATQRSRPQSVGYCTAAPYTPTSQAQPISLPSPSRHACGPRDTLAGSHGPHALTRALHPHE